MPNNQAPTEEDIKIMVINTVNHWREQRKRYAKKLEEYDELLRKIGVDLDQEPLKNVDLDDESDDDLPTSESTEIRVRPGAIHDAKPVSSRRD